MPKAAPAKQPAPTDPADAVIGPRLARLASRDTITVADQTFVLVPEDDYRRNAGLPPLAELPPADAKGRRPAAEFARASIARTVVRDREAAGMTQRELAAAAGITPAMLCRVERATVTAGVATLSKIEAALEAAKAKAAAARHAGGRG